MLHQRVSPLSRSRFNALLANGIWQLLYIFLQQLEPLTMIEPSMLKMKCFHAYLQTELSQSNGLSSQHRKLATWQRS